eukprot:11682271-Alexandrium_andersonii.AAC.1
MLACFCANHFGGKHGIHNIQSAWFRLLHRPPARRRNPGLNPCDEKAEHEQPAHRATSESAAEGGCQPPPPPPPGQSG